MDAIERQVTLPVDVEEAWALLTDPHDLAAWLGAEVELDLVPGACGRVVDADGTVRRVMVDDVVAGRRMAWHWWDEERAETTSRVEIAIVPTAEGTTVRVREELAAATPVASARAAEAWSHRLLHLEALLLVAAAVRG